VHDASFHNDLNRKAVHEHEHVDDNVDVLVDVDVDGFGSMLMIQNERKIK
jgi:hypothetical protein